MNDLWIKPALIGVEQCGTFGLDGQIGALLERVGDNDDPALGFSRCAGVLAACELAATTLDATPVQVPEAAAEDANALPPANPWTTSIAEIFATAQIQQGYEARLKHEACMRLSDAGFVLPPPLLPSALEAGQRNQLLRAASLPVLGNRGRWLASQNPEWKYAAGVDRSASAADEAKVWQEGNQLDRLAYFRRLRANGAAAGRALLQTSLGELPAKERLEFVAALEPDLHADDTQLLEPLLKDRSRDVRLAAGRLLARLPESAHAQRLIGWIAPLLTQKRGLLGRSWLLEAPEAADAAWAQAVIDAKRPQHESLGERAWWLYQLVQQVPLSWWTQQTGMTPADLIRWAGKTDWAAALHRGWRERVSAAEPDWIEALLDSESREARADTSALLGLLPVAQRERHWPDHIDALWKNGLAYDLIASFTLGDTLSARYSKPLFASLLSCFQDDRLRHDYGLRAVLLELAALLHPDVLSPTLSVPRRADETPAMAECALAFERIIQLRAALRAATTSTRS